MLWVEELSAVVAEAGGDLALAAGLLALRKTEAGAAGREFGVLSVSAPTYAEQLRVAANSLRHREMQYRLSGGQSREAATGLFTEPFLRFFSEKWAPVGAENDPHGTNRNHAANLVALAGGFGTVALATLRQAWAVAGMSPSAPLPSGA